MAAIPVLLIHISPAKPRKINFESPCESRKKPLTFAPRFNRRQERVEKRNERKIKFHLSLVSSKLLLTFALPIAERGIERKKNRQFTPPHYHANWADTRSLNVWKRQIVRASYSDVGSRNYKRNTNT
jgi:hypothetical protein